MTTLDYSIDADDARRAARAALERARVVAVLDGWRAKDTRRKYEVSRGTRGSMTERVTLTHHDCTQSECFFGATPDEARAAAAAAIEKGDV